jgi:hypothetical protein
MRHARDRLMTRPAFVVSVAMTFVAGTLPASAQQGWTGDTPTISAIGVVTAPSVGIDGRGGTAVTWSQCADTTCSVMVTRHTAAAGWSAPAAITPAGDYHGPQLAVGVEGNITVIWTRGNRTLQAVRYSAASGEWGLPVTIGADVSERMIGADALGNAVVVWLSGSGTLTNVVQASRYSAANGLWLPAVTLSVQPAATPSLAINPGGNAVVVWGTPFGNPTPILAARFDASSAAWLPAVGISSGSEYAFKPAVGMDAAGNAIVAWATGTIGVDFRVMFSRFDEATATWSAPALVAPIAGDHSTSPRIAVDAAGNATALWTERFQGFGYRRLQAVRFASATGTWGPKLDVADADDGVRTMTDAAGNVFALWVREFGFVNPRLELEAIRFSVQLGTWGRVRRLASPDVTAVVADLSVSAAGTAAVAWLARAARLEAVQSTFWLASPNAPDLSGAGAAAGRLSLTFTAPQTAEAAFGPANYAYSLDDGATWTERMPADTASPLVIGGLVDGCRYPVRIRAINHAGAGVPSVRLLAVPGSGSTAPFDLTIASIRGNAVTLEWTAPAAGLVPTSYVVEGGVHPGEVLASIPTGSTAPTYTFVAPTGAFYVRIHGVTGSIRSGPSNEIRIFVNLPVPPSAPANLLGLVNGSNIALSWTNTYAGGTPTALWLNVSGAITATLPLPVGETFAYPDVPPGTYTLMVSASNPSGMSQPSNPVTLTFPTPCTGVPLIPTNLQAWTVGRTIFLSWSPPANGPAVTSYTVIVGGAYVGTFPIGGRTISGTVGPGTYVLSVSASNACGAGPATLPQTVVVP